MMLFILLIKLIFIYFNKKFKNENYFVNPVTIIMRFVT